MLAKVHSCAIVGLEGAIVEVEVDTARGLPSFTIVGLPDTAVQESRERVHAAIKNAGMTFPGGHLTVNPAPASLRKEGPAYDLPIALGTLAASGQLRPEWLDGALVVGELSLDGSVRHVAGMLPMAALAAKEGFKRIFVPAGDAAEAALIEGLEVIPVENLTALANHLSGVKPIPPAAHPVLEMKADRWSSDFREVRGQEHVKRALEVAAGGSHNVLMVGPPGAGKTLLARALPSILPAMSVEEVPQHPPRYRASGPFWRPPFRVRLATSGPSRMDPAPVAYPGIGPVVFQTGEFPARSARMSKRGSHYVRRAIWEAAQVAARDDTTLTVIQQTPLSVGIQRARTCAALE